MNTNVRWQRRILTAEISRSPSDQGDTKLSTVAVEGWQGGHRLAIRMLDMTCVFGLVLMMGCAGGEPFSTDISDGKDGGPDSSQNDAISAGIMLSGVLVAGAQTSEMQPTSRLATLPAPSAAYQQSALGSEGEPLEGYQLYCVTFATPPAAASGTADATGQVSLDLDALGVAFGCFILDADANGVATLIFSSGAEQGQTVTLTGDTDLGEITVDLNNGVAQTVVTNADTITGSSDLPCPLGSWVIDVPRDDCTGMAKATTWFIREETGAMKVSFTLGPVQLAGTDGTCGNVSQVDILVTENDGSLTFSFPDDPVGCPSRMRTLVATPNDDCTEIVMASSLGPCLACSDGQCGCEEGTETCTANFTATRE